MNITTSKTYNNWLILLEDLVAGKVKLSETDHRDLTGQATGWPTCACGQLCSTLPRDEIGAPEDETLYSNGITFAGEIQSGEWLNALTTFKRIEARAAKLIKLGYYQW